MVPGSLGRADSRARRFFSWVQGVGPGTLLALLLLARSEPFARASRRRKGVLILVAAVGVRWGAEGVTRSRFDTPETSNNASEIRKFA